MHLRKRFFSKRGPALLLAGILCLFLAACDGNEHDNGISGVPVAGSAVYIPENVPLPAALRNNITSACLDGGTLYLTVPRAEQVEAESNGFTFTVDQHRDQLMRVELGETEALPLPNFVPAALPVGAYGSVNLRVMGAVGDGTLWIQEAVVYYYYDLPDTFDPGTEYEYSYRTGETHDTFLRLLDSEGRELRRVEIGRVLEKLGLDPEDTYFRHMEEYDFDAAGNLYIPYSPGGKLYILDDGLNHRFTLEGRIGRSMITLMDGSKAVRRSISDGGKTEYRLTVVDPETGDWGAGYRLPGGSETLYSGGGGFAFCYDDGVSVYGWEVESDTYRKLFNWYDTTLNQSGVNCFSFLNDGRLAVMTRDGSGGTLALLTETDRQEAALPEKTVLIYGTLSYTWPELEAMIGQFNRTNSEYIIQVRNYLEMNDGDLNNAMTQFAAELQAGMIPDIFDGHNLPVKALAEAGYLEDLWPWIEGDPQIGRERLMTRPFEADSLDGRLYRIFRSFQIETVIGASDIVGSGMSWSIADMRAAYEKMPVGATVFNASHDLKSNWLATMMDVNLDSFVDWDTGTCSFDSGEFKEILAFCNTFRQNPFDAGDSGDPLQSEVHQLQAGRQMLVTEAICCWRQIQYHKFLFGGEVTFVGYPTVDGNAGSAFDMGLFDPSMAMSAACEDKETVWAFMRQVLLPKGEQYKYADWFPINKADFELVAQTAMTPDYETDRNGELILDEAGDPIEKSTGRGGYNGLWVDYYATTQEEYQQILALYNATGRMFHRDDAVYAMIDEVAGKYFAGDITLDSAAEQIQSRVRLYVNEKL